VIRAVLHTTETSKVEAFRVAFKAGFCGWGVSGSLDKGAQDKLQAFDATITGSLIGGTTSQQGAFLRGLPAVKAFLDAYEAEKIKITPCAISCDIQSLWASLSPYPEVQRMLESYETDRLARARTVESDRLKYREPAITVVGVELYHKATAPSAPDKQWIPANQGPQRLQHLNLPPGARVLDAWYTAERGLRVHLHFDDLFITHTEREVFIEPRSPLSDNIPGTCGMKIHVLWVD
jgi:hypothetical protein